MMGAGYKVHQWVFVTDETSAQSLEWSMLAVNLHAGAEALDFLEEGDVGCLITLR